MTVSPVRGSDVANLGSKLLHASLHNASSSSGSSSATGSNKSSSYGFGSSFTSNTQSSSAPNSATSSAFVTKGTGPLCGTLGRNEHPPEASPEAKEISFDLQADTNSASRL